MGYDLKAMYQAIAQCDKNIETFEAAIEKEQNTKKEYKRIIRDLEEKEQLIAEAKKNVTIEIVKEN